MLLWCTADCSNYQHESSITTLVISIMIMVVVGGGRQGGGSLGPESKNKHSREISVKSFYL